MSVLIAVNGTLMRGLPLNKNLIDAGATFIREDQTAQCYRLWSIDDKHPAMLRALHKGKSITVEIWSVPITSIANILVNEPDGLSIGKILLIDNTIVLGVLGESFLCHDQHEITEHGGWRNYIKALTTKL